MRLHNINIPNPIKGNSKKYLFIVLIIIFSVFRSNSLFACQSNPPTASFSVDNAAPVVDETVTFTDSSEDNGGGEINSWNWDFGVDATPASGNMQGPYDVSYSTSGVKTVSLRVTNDDGNDTKTMVVNVIALFYSTGSGNPSATSSWNSQRNGSGFSPSSTTGGHQKFIVQNNHTMTTTGAWGLGQYSSIQIESGGTLVENHNITIQPNGSLWVADDGMLNHNVSSTSIFGGTEVFGQSSTVNYGLAGNQQVAVAAYGNLTLSGGGTKTLVGSVSVANNLSIKNSTTLETGTNNTLTASAAQATASFTMEDGSNFKIGDGCAFQSGFSYNSISMANSSTVSYLAPDLAVASAPYGNLIIDGGGTIQGDVRVNKSLNLENGNLSTGAGTNSITIGAGATLSAAGGFSATRMIVCDGDGSLIIEANNLTNLETVYPVGSGGVYSPVQVTSFAGTIDGTTCSFGVRAKEGRAQYANVNDLQRHWITEIENIISPTATMTFTYGAGESTGTYSPMYSVGTEWFEVVNSSQTPTTFTVNNVVELSGVTWSLLETAITTYYSYQSGPWNVATTWTTDPSGSLSTNPAVPGSTDRIVILNGRTVNVTQAHTVVSTQINEGGTLDLGTTTGHDLGSVKGQGLLRLSTNNFPGGVFTEFVSADGGTVEYYNPAADFNFQQYNYNNLIINFANTNRIARVTGDMNINGNLSIQSGIYQINNNTGGAVRTINTLGSVNIGVNGRIQLGTGNFNHRFIVKGDFTNNGVVRFTNQYTPNYTGTPNNGRADAIFNNTSADQSIVCNGQTHFYRIEIKKDDIAYVLNIDASETGNFRLFGRNNHNPEGTPPNIPNPQALGLLSGTVRLGENIVIPSIAETGVYNIDEDAMIWLDGASVRYSTQTNTADGTTLIIYGGLRISGNSVFNDNSKQGLVMRTSSSLLIEDGNVTTECVRTSYEAGTHRGAFTMTGGELTIRAVSLPDLNGMDVYAAFTLPYPDNTLTIAGGTINIESPNPRGNGSGTNFSYVVGANPNNISITGGVFNITVPAARNAYIASIAPFWDLNIISAATNRSAQPRTYTSNSRVPVPIPAQPLVVLNNLTLVNRAVLTSGPDNVDVSIGNNFTVNTNTTYTPGTNTTTFNGTGSQAFTYSGTITSGLNNLTLGGTSSLTLGGTQGTLTVRNNLELGSGTTLRDGNKVITVAGNISNSGTHYRPAGAAGRIELAGNAVQTITGDGKGSFNNLSINKTGGSVTLSNPTTVNGNLRLVSNHRFNIGYNTLTLGSNGGVYSAATGTDQVFSANKMIVTNGLASDGGVKKIFSNTNEFVYPFGFQLGATHYYMPAHIQFSSAPTQWGSITSRPVNERHYLAQSTNALKAYWKNTSKEFDGVPQNSVNHRYFYATDVFVEGTEASYVPAVYRPGGQWVSSGDVNDVDQSINQITFASQSVGSGEYTAGETSAFTEIPILYSSGDGFWDDLNTWSAVGVGQPGGAGIPGSNTIVIIGDGANFHTVTIQTANVASGALFISEGSMLDLGTTQGHNFAAIPEETVAGAGTLRISSSNYFPDGDFGDFIEPNGGTVEYYANSVPINIPTISAGSLSLNRYSKLVLNHQGYVVNLPDMDLTIHKDITVKGSGQSARTNTGGSWTTLNVLGNFNVESGGDFSIMEGTPSKTLRVYGNVNVASGATFRVRTSAASTNHTLELYGDINNEGTFNLHQTDSQVSTQFKGTANTEIKGGGSYNFYDITVDKGSDATPVVTLKSEITTGKTNPFLTLTNGTFRVDIDDVGSQVVRITDGGTSFTIPVTAALSVQNGSVGVAYGNGTGKLNLAGKLEVLGGNMYIGNPATANNNSIEYAAAGTPVIDVRGGNLSVNGQIRRPTTITSGALNYIQSGGTTTIYGKSRIENRGLIEIVNTNSLFSMSGGTLQFDRPSAAGTTFGDIYLRPGQSVITGGTLQAGLATSAKHTFRLNSSSPLWNVSLGVTGFSQVLENDVQELEILNDLTIRCNSQLNANGLNITIGGNFINRNISSSAGIDKGGFLAGSPTQTVTFNGSGAQSITGNGTNLTNFANLTIASGGTVTLQPQTTLRVNSSLNLSAGVLNDGGNSISVVGNIANTSTHTSGSVDGGLILVGTQNQNLNGVGGSFGNITTNNSTGATLQNNITINGRLTFTNGSIYIDDYQVVFGENASIGGTPDKTRMLILNGVLSDQGVRKQFGAGASSFTFPIGVSGKYTPANFAISSNGAPGAITVNPVNRRHPAVVTPSENELAYYWKVDSTGFDSNLVLTHTYTYDPSDAKPVVANYVVGLYKIHEYKWFDLGNTGVPGSVNSGSNSFTISGVGYVSGDFTAGEADNFTPPLTTYYSHNTTGNWFTADDWLVGGPSGTIATQIPNGNPVVIQENHTMTLSQNSAYSVSVEVIGTLACGNTVFHDLGTVFGTGKIEITSTNDGFFVFPGGSFDEFLETPGTTVEFKGDNTASLPPKPGNIYKPFQNVIFSGTGQKNMSSESMRVLGNLTISNGTKLNNSLYNKSLYVSGSWINENTGTNMFVPGAGTVYFEGSSLQNIDVAARETFYNLTMINTGAGAEITGTSGIDITRRLTLTNGVLKSASGKEVRLTNTNASIAASGGSSASYVDGPLSKRIVNGQSFNYPVGNAGRLGRITLSNVTASTSPEYWTATYVKSNPHPTYPTATENLEGALTAVSDNEHWIVNRPTGGTPSANIKLRWDGNSLPSYTNDPTLRLNLRVVEFKDGSPGLWSARGQSVSGTAASGTVSTTTPVTQDDYIFTIGAIGVTAAITDFTPKEVCDNENTVSIPVELTGVAPWSLSYSVGGTIFTETDINSSSYSISIRGSDFGQGVYDVKLVSVSSAGNAGAVASGSVTLTVLLTHKPSISGAASVGAGETRHYSTTNNGSTYAWSWVGAQGGDPNTSVGSGTDINFNKGAGTYVLQVEEVSSSGCSAIDQITIEVLNIPVPEITPDEANLCQGAKVNYSTTSIAGNQYRWSVTGSSTVSPTNYNDWREGGNSIEVTWNTVGNGSITVEERVGTSSTQGSDTKNFVVYKQPAVPALEATPAGVCAGSSVDIEVTNSETGITYQLISAGNPVGGTIAGNGGSITLTIPEVLSTASYYVRAYNLGCEAVSGDFLVTAYPNPLVNWVSLSETPGDLAITICEGDPAELNIGYLVNTGNFSLEIFHDLDTNPIESLDQITTNPFKRNVNPTWDGVTMPPSTTYKYRVVITDEHGCVSEPIPEANQPEITVWKRPETGPQYHIPNTHGE
ncbi:MAG: PKD domain-containing protein [Tenuifilaceae bacterium]|nr:PKD domain-containing protein [Tenuifilaceae bacterium]